MSDNGGCGTAAAMLLLMAVLIGAIAFGAPIITGDGLSWDNSAAIARTNARLEAERLRLASETRQAIEREETARVISENMMTTLQWLAVVVGVVAVVGALGWTAQRSVEAWAARPHRPQAPPQQIVMVARPFLMAQPDARVDLADMLRTHRIFRAGPAGEQMLPVGDLRPPRVVHHFLRGELVAQMRLGGNHAIESVEALVAHLAERLADVRIVILVSRHIEKGQPLLQLIRDIRIHNPHSA